MEINSHENFESILKSNITVEGNIEFERISNITLHISGECPVVGEENRPKATVTLKESDDYKIVYSPHTQNIPWKRSRFEWRIIPLKREVTFILAVQVERRQERWDFPVEKTLHCKMSFMSYLKLFRRSIWPWISSLLFLILGAFLNPLFDWLLKKYL